MSAQNDTAFLRMFLMVLGALVVFTIIILILANQITGSVEEERGQDPRLRAVILENIKPVGSVNVASASAEPAAPKSGAEIVASACNSCHGAGVLGAPKVGDKDAWMQRMNAEGGVDGLLASAIKGKNSMPPRGGSTASDEELRSAIVTMLTDSGVEVDAAASAPAAESAPAADSASPAAAPAAAAAVAPAMAEAPAVPQEATAATPAAEASPSDVSKGKTVYATACFACHDTGAAGAPKKGDKAAWAPRIAQGMETLFASSINGKGAMPPKGGQVQLPDDDIKAAVSYMVSESQ